MQMFVDVHLNLHANRISRWTACSLTFEMRLQVDCMLEFEMQYSDTSACPMVENFFYAKGLV